MKFEYTPKGVCSRRMEIEIEGDTVVNLSVHGGCNGNLKGIAALCRGRRVDEVIEALEGLVCGNKNTSCPDQLAQALKTCKLSVSK
ncbi:MAG: TIGR03905 family TSCPD domain-containing protein [Muribaculaceae bacterium]|nr:TIGR03905 family TSCPD domain-containing protein [Muribaculaceae bacterium]